MQEEGNSESFAQDAPMSSVNFISRRATLFTPEDVCPLPKAPPRKNASEKGCKRVKSTVLTDTPIKNQLVSDIIEREKKKRKSKINKKGTANAKMQGVRK